MVDTGPANYDGDQVISMNPIQVYEATFYRQSTDVTLHLGGDDGLNWSLNGANPGSWAGSDPDGTHQGLPGFIDVTTSNPFPDGVYHSYGTTPDGFVYGAVPAMLNAITTSFQAIYTVWQNLSLSWIGNSSDAAQELQSQLDKIQNRLFGTKIDNQNQPGVLEQMSSVASDAASIFSNVEEANTTMFNNFADDINWQPLPDENANDNDNLQQVPGGVVGAVEWLISLLPPPTTPHDYGPITETF
jgi:hypothetical protein